jgi:hypothetical protein
MKSRYRPPTAPLRLFCVNWGSEFKWRHLMEWASSRCPDVFCLLKHSSAKSEMQRDCILTPWYKNTRRHGAYSCFALITALYLKAATCFHDLCQNHSDRCIMSSLRVLEVSRTHELPVASLTSGKWSFRSFWRGKRTHNCLSRTVWGSIPLQCLNSETWMKCPEVFALSHWSYCGKGTARSVK